MKLKKLTTLALIVSIPLTSCSSFDMSRKTNLLNVGMSKAQVRSALGDPSKTSAIRESETWYYEKNKSAVASNPLVKSAAGLAGTAFVVGTAGVGMGLFGNNNVSGKRLLASFNSGKLHSYRLY